MEKTEVEVKFSELLERVRKDFPELRFREGKKFMFRPPRTVIFVQKCGEDENDFGKMQLLHEVGHALLGHRDWETDLVRVKMECAAWEKAKELSKKYEVRYEEEFAEEELDSYRDWLHQRSKCKQCGLTRYQTRDGEYHCPQCEAFGAQGDRQRKRSLI